MSISNWPSAERPREKLIQHGAATLSDAEVSTSDVLALQHYLEGVQQKQPETNKSLRLAELAFREALARDPGFIEAKLEPKPIQKFVLHIHPHTPHKAPSTRNSLVSLLSSLY